MIKKEEAENYYSKDFDWDELRQEIENDPSLLYHLLPFIDGENGNATAEMGRVESSTPSSVGDSEAWNEFHARHSTGKFFKERRYLLKEFPELASCGDYCKVLEVGCGNGSTVLPVLRGKETIVVYACDCSNEALDRAKEMISAANLASAINRFYPFLCDFSTSSFPMWLACNSCRKSFLQKPHVNCSERICFSRGDIYKAPCSEESSCCIGGVDLVTFIFTLSALPLERMPIAIQECFSVLKPGGMLLFRDYGLYDMTMLRFPPEQKVGYREYKRSDGTRSYFFSLESLRDLFSSAGFIVVHTSPFRTSPVVFHSLRSISFSWLKVIGAKLSPRNYLYASLSLTIVVLDPSIVEMGKSCEGCGFTGSSRSLVWFKLETMFYFG